MPDLRLKPDRETYDLLVKQADAERRPVAWQAEVMLRKAVGLPFPSPPVDAHGTELRLQKVERLDPQPFTALGWQVADIDGVVTKLAAAHVAMERYGWLEQDASGIWRAPSGACIAWFKDPDGNLLSIAQYPSIDGA